MSDIKEFAILFSSAMLLVLILIVVVTIPATLMENYTCTQYEKVTGKETHYVWFDACYVEHKAAMVRYSAYEKMIIASDGLGGLND